LSLKKVSELYDQVVSAKRKCGEKLGALSLEVFTQFLTSRAEQIKDYLATDAVDFVVASTMDGSSSPPALRANRHRWGAAPLVTNSFVDLFASTASPRGST
jgi:hypothetical protein